MAGELHVGREGTTSSLMVRLKLILLPKRRYGPAVERAWQAVLARVGPQGSFVDVCESTAQAQTLDDYMSRTAILGPDPRGGAMTLMFATELAGIR